MRYLRLFVVLAIAAVAPISKLRAQEITEFLIPGNSPATRIIQVIYVPEDDTLWVLQSDPGTANKILRFERTGTIQTIKLPTGANPSQILYNNALSVAYIDQTRNVIGRISVKILSTISEQSITAKQTQIAAPGLIAIARTRYDSEMAFSLPSASKVGTISIPSEITDSIFYRDLPTPSPNADLTGITLAPDNFVWYADNTSKRIFQFRFNFGTDAFTQYQTPAQSLKGLVTGPDGALWFLDPVARQVGRMTLTGSVTMYPLPTMNAPPDAILAGPDGNLWITQPAIGRIVRMTTAGRATEYATGGVTYPVSPVVGPDGAIWYAQSLTNKLARFTVPTATTVVGAVHSSQTATQSYFRFLNKNTNGAKGAAQVKLLNANTAQSYGTWTTPELLPGQSIQIPISTIEQSLGIQSSPPAYYTAEIDATYQGQVQHTLFRNGALLNSSTCGAGSVGAGTQLVSVHAGLLNPFYASTISVVNTGSVNATARLSILDTNGIVRGTYQTDTVAGAQKTIPMSLIINNSGITSPSPYHYNIRLEQPFKGYLQHHVTNSAARMMADMTAMCDLNGTPPPAEITQYQAFSTTGSPTAITADKSNNVWFIDSESNRINRIDFAGNISQFRTLTDTQRFYDITGAPDGSVWFTQSNLKVGRFSELGVLSEVTVAQPTIPTIKIDRIAAMPDNTILVAKTVSSSYQPMYRIVGLNGVSSGPNTARAMLPMPDNTLWYWDPIGSLTKAKADQTNTFISVQGILSFIEDMTVGPDSNVWAVDKTASRIVKVDADGKMIQFALPPTLRPSRIAKGADERLWFIDEQANILGAITTLGEVSLYNFPRGKDLTADSNGTLWITHSHTNTISRLIPKKQPRISHIYSKYDGDDHSFLRLYNGGISDTRFTVTLAQNDNGTDLPIWISPLVKPKASLQVALSEIENVINAQNFFTRMYTAKVSAHMPGAVQHVVYRPTNNTFTNFSTCEANTAAATTLINVHGQPLEATYPSTIVVTNTSTQAASPSLSVYDAANGNLIGTYAVGSLPASGQRMITMADIEAALGQQSSGRYHYNVQFTAPSFKGHLQHLIHSTSNNVVLDMSTVCKLN